jgi:hypothetical protein
VAVIFPRVAVRVVEAVKEPVTAVFPVALPMFVAPVPPVPIVVTPAPEALMLAVPVWVNAAKVVNPPVAVRVVPMTAEVVTERDDPAVNVVPDASVVVVAREPGAVIAAGRDTVATDPAVVTVT